MFKPAMIAEIKKALPDDALKAAGPLPAAIEASPPTVAPDGDSEDAGEEPAAARPPGYTEAGSVVILPDHDVLVEIVKGAAGSQRVRVLTRRQLPNRR
jgi:hypothetical protein